MPTPLFNADRFDWTFFTRESIQFTQTNINSTNQNNVRDAKVAIFELPSRMRMKIENILFGANANDSFRSQLGSADVHFESRRNDSGFLVNRPFHSQENPSGTTCVRFDKLIKQTIIICESVNIARVIWHRFASLSQHFVPDIRLQSFTKNLCTITHSKIHDCQSANLSWRSDLWADVSGSSATLIRRPNNAIYFPHSQNKQMKLKPEQRYLDVAVHSIEHFC